MPNQPSRRKYCAKPFQLKSINKKVIETSLTNLFFGSPGIILGILEEVYWVIQKNITLSKANTSCQGHKGIQDKINVRYVLSSQQL